jgi:DeoR/GlpR family transcriptional regulator of sugar metabolism
MKDRDVDITKYHFVKTPYLHYRIRTRQRFEQLQTIIEESPLTTTELIARTGLKPYTVQRLLRQLRDRGKIKKALGRWYASHQESDNGYLTIAEAARIHNVGLHIIRQRIRERDIFKGAKKEKRQA